MIQQLKQIWASLSGEHRGVIHFVFFAAVVALLWVATIAYGLGFTDGHDAAKTPHIPPTVELNELIR